MLRFRLRQIAEKKGITTAYQLQEAMRIRPGTAAKLWKKGNSPREGISFGTIEKLCNALGCRPGDLFEYEPLVSKKEKRPKPLPDS
jgi:DNA-binding Xre family transcriptional regulator